MRVSMRLVSLACSLLVVIALQASTAAHHSPRVYRLDEQTTIEGVIVAVIYKSPHTYLHVQAPDRERQLRVWAVECGDARQLRPRFEQGALRPGDRVVITGEPARDEGTWRVRLRTLLRPTDGWGWREMGR